MTPLASASLVSSLLLAISAFIWWLRKVRIAFIETRELGAIAVVKGRPGSRARG